MFKPSFSSSSTNPSSDQTGAGVKYKGVRLRKWGKYVSEIRLPNSRERIWLGSYDSPEKAARAFDAAQFCLRGRNANFNFPDSSSRIELVEYSRPLTPSEIQEFASRYANGADHHEEQQQQQPTMELPEDYPALPASETFDYWQSSYYDDMVADPAAGTTSDDINNVVPDYDLMMSSLDRMHEEMYMTPHLGTSFHDYDSNGGRDEEQNVVDEQFYSQQSFLWNF